jgi:RimJ/RimL family protein N-acetyltransferase
MEDVPDAHAIFSDPVVMACCEAPYTLKQTEEQVAFFRRSGIALAARHRQQGRMISHLLFKQMPGEAQGIYEIGWIFHRGCWRQGYAYEAANALIEHGFAELHLHKICAETISPVSVHLMRKLGMEIEGVFRQHTKNPQGQWADVTWACMLNPLHHDQTTGGTYE